MELDQRVRLAAFAFLEGQVRVHGSEVLPRELLVKGFEFEGERVPLMAPQGIFKPRLLDLPLSITTAPEVEGRDRPYDDRIGEDGLLDYRYRGTDPAHRDNAGLREAMARRVPLVYFHGMVPGRYWAQWPVFIVGDTPARLTFSVAVDDARHVIPLPGEADRVAEARREYVTVEARRRLHQQGFRERVLRAYREQCAICRLKHAELLDAAHILPDGHPKGHPVVPNGLALCTLHHAAFDRSVLGIRPDLVVEVRADVLKEIDGPMLKHGLQGFQGVRIQVPRAESQRPDRQALEERWGMFRKAV